MSSKKKSKKNVGEIQVQKSPAEFFAENQAIAGFDNMGKSLYTSIRELVENSLDACESIQVLPEISVAVTEYTQAEFNALAEMGDSPRKIQQDRELFQKKKRGKSKKSDDEDKEEKTPSAKKKLNADEKTPAKPSDSKDTKTPGSKTKRKAPQDAYFRITVSDNGCGMQHKAIPDLFGRVLSGSKYGVRQTRGKFGLGAKMALIWSKKSSGQPIRITTAHRPTPDSETPEKVSHCLLDIDIYKNEPRVLEHTLKKNTTNMIGTTVEVLIAGNWTTYRSRIVQYLQQLAIITPYALLGLTYENASDPKRRLDISYARRSEQMPPPAKTVKHHPSSVNNLIIQQLVQVTRAKTMLKFLSKELASVSPALAKRLIAELASSKVTEEMLPTDLSDKQITRLVQLLRQVQLFKAPDGSCLSPAGEYNLNLGIRKVLEPDLIATVRDKPSAYEGHPFVVEAAVSLGGAQAKEGITVMRFANRIPLLFEGGADVSTRVAQTKIRWSNYKIDYKKDKVGVFVSIVSTKVPFKGTSKEYIGDDATAIQLSVKRALQSCCQQLKAHLMKRNALKDAAQRKSRLTKYIPDVGRALFGLLDGMRKRRAEAAADSSDDDAPASPTKRLRLDPDEASGMIQQLNDGHVSEKVIRTVLTETIDEQQPQQGEDELAKDDESRVPLFLTPLYNMEDPQNDVICHPLFSFRPIHPISPI